MFYVIVSSDLSERGNLVFEIASPAFAGGQACIRNDNMKIT